MASSDEGPKVTQGPSGLVALLKAESQVADGGPKPPPLRGPGAAEDLDLGLGRRGRPAEVLALREALLGREGED